MDGFSTSARHSRSRGRGEQSPAGLLVNATDAGLAAAVFVLPLVMGGRQAWGHLALTLIACFTALAWAIHQILTERPRWRWSGAEPLFVMGVALVVLQIVRLPQQTLNRVSPAIAERLPMWSADAPFGEWRTISLTPQDTLDSLLCVAACMLLFVVAVQRLQRKQDVARLMTWIGLSAAGMAAFGAAQLVAGNGKFFWVYEHPFTDTRHVAKGAFTNANHFAHFVALGIPIWLWRFVTAGAGGADSRGWQEGRVGDPRQRLDAIVAGVCLAVISLALLVSQSRGGLAVGAGGAAVTLFCLWRQRLVGVGTVGSVSAIAAAGGIALVMFGGRIEQLVERNLNEIATTDLDKLDQGEARRRVWRAVLAAAKEFPIAGTGLSSHVEVYPTYDDSPSSGIEYTHAENGYLQIAMELGLTGLTLAGLFILLVGYWCLRGLRLAKEVQIGAPLAAATACLAINLAHSVTDFIWYVPSCMVHALLMTACAFRLYQLSSPAPEPAAEAAPLVRTGWATMAIALVAFATFSVRQEWPAVLAEPHWFDYIRLTQATQNSNAEADPESDVGLARQRLGAAVAAVRANPGAHRMQLAAARSYYQYARAQQEQSDNGMPLPQVREAARSNFETIQDMRTWLAKPGVLGDRRKLLEAAGAAARRSLQGCPLSARAYLLVSDVAWIQGATEDVELELLAQAHSVRPFDARVHYMLGCEDFKAQRFDDALAHWREAFHRDANYRRQLVVSLVGMVPARFFLENFDIDRDALIILRIAYRESPDEAGYRTVVSRLSVVECQSAKAAVGDAAARHWMTACGLFNELQEPRRSAAAARAAVKANPSSLDARLLLGNVLFNQGAYEEASEHLTWCVHRRPDDAQLRKRTETAILRMGEASRTRIAAEQDGDSVTR
ncbi:MAG: O-antigen ligase family protein [Planctomyces sp.]|nr:O-antigen ligase family protein [Planctomyces sp.]